MKPSVEKHLSLLLLRYPALSACRESLQKAFMALYAGFSDGHRLYTCGNGGSAADAQHIVGELMKSFVLPRPLAQKDVQALCSASPENGAAIARYLQGALPAFSLVGEVALTTAYANDVAPEMNFAQQVFGYGQEGDVLLALSTSGNSQNVLYAADAAHARGMAVIGLTGSGGGKLRACADVLIAVPETETYKIQELHLPVYHTLCLMLEEAFFGNA